MSIAHWPEAERPREKLLQRGPAVLSDAELLAIFLRTGIRGCSAVDMGRQLIQRFGSLGKLLAAEPGDFARGSGLGPAKYAQFMAVKELARRVLAEEMQLGDALSSPQAVRQYLRLAIGVRDVEVFVALFLTAQNRVLAVEEVFRGTLTETRVYPREIVRRALQHNAHAVIVAHNHPSGVAEPSAADRALTASLKQALALVDISLLDHFVVTGSHAESLAERGWM
ncbi:RadC family protein [Vogesella indigofera]|uniref:RadC family protein n=1 Tax=Vogesella indigofera TaxID=45465 RepID=UPI00234E9C9B|nr:DNA repair protein RadC [Vogesella indigofera]MDC7699613.1 DNA repair protein RadC [Vogesella indigofera]MDC7708681.1 DNA repair protein RadC [Vogesella indigofera]